MPRVLPDDILSLFHRPTPLLERFRLSHDLLHTENQFTQHVVTFLPYAPRLHSLELAACMLQRLPQARRPSLRQVDLGFCFGENHSHLVLDFLSTSSSVEDASIYARLRQPRPLQTRLRSPWRLSRGSGSDSTPFCPTNVLSLPALRSIHVFGYGAEPGAQGLFHKYAHIRELVLTSSRARDVTPGQLPRVLGSLRRLASLRLGDFPVSRDDFVPLSAPNQATGTWTLPALVEFDVTYGSLDIEAALSCSDFVRSRTVDNVGSGLGGRVHLTRVDVRSSSKGVNQLDWLQNILSSMCGNVGVTNTEDEQ